jgi:hypothetical protein
MAASDRRTKERLSASVDADLVAAGLLAVSEGRADSLSGWVNEALEMKAAHDGRLRAMDEFLADYEAEHGEISAAEMEEAHRRRRSQAIVVRGAPKSRESPARRGA